jgi:hypothetical protein
MEQMESGIRRLESLVSPDKGRGNEDEVKVEEEEEKGQAVGNAGHSALGTDFDLLWNPWAEN